MIEPFWKGMSVVLTRRMLIALLAGALLSSEAAPVFARDGGESEGGDDGGHDDGGHDDGGSDNSGHDDGGSDSNGGDNGGNDGGGGDNGGGDKGNDDGNGDDHGNKRSNALSQDEALKEREKGQVIPLETALRIAGAKVRGRVIDVDLSVRSGAPQYRVKIRRDDGVIKTVRLNARTGKVIGFFGF
jgi:hypothetical protein